MNGQLKKTLAAIGEATEVCLRVVFPDGSSYQSRERPPDTTVIIRNSRVAWRVLLFGHVGFLEAYFNGDVDVEGNLALAFRAAMDAGFDERPTFLVSVRNWWHELRYSNASIAQAKANARFHYGPGQDFYREWLDQVGMAYTCSWFMDGTKTLEEAQISKMDHVCRKVLLKAGDAFADIGSGWGNLLFYAWEKYGALGTGINATTEQVHETRAEIKRRGLEGRVEVLERDFREVPRQFDKLLSIGTLEHAGRDQLGEVVQAHANYLKPGGLGVIHFIGH
ncbi:MAG TPA: class I SAM-dependent methyltransferase, partial [Burkholderiales bacterium]